MASPLGAPPGPIGWPLLGVLPRFRKNPAKFLLEVSREFGDVSSFRMGMRKTYLLNRPDLIEEILVTSQGNFVKSRVLQRSRWLLGEGLLTSEGQFHIRQRKLVQPAFYRERLAGYAGMMVAAADRSQGRWKSGETLDMQAEMMRLTLAIVGLTLFSHDIEEEGAADIGRALTDVIATFDTMLSPFAWLLERLPFGKAARAKKAREVLDRKIYEIIRERRKSGRDRGDLLSTLILANEEGEPGMTDKQVRDEALTLLLAGHETTANALTWAWYLLSLNPDVERRLRLEWAEVLGGRLPEFEDYPKLVYTEQVFAEVMRLYPPAWTIGRMTVNQFRLYNFVLKPRTICLMSPYVMHRNPRFWPDPEQFDPDRFTPEEKATRPKFAYFPFGGGPRVCLGERFAWLEGVLLLATIGQNWRFSLDPGQQVDIHPQITLRPRYGMKMKASRVVA